MIASLVHESKALYMFRPWTTHATTLHQLARKSFHYLLTNDFIKFEVWFMNLWKPSLYIHGNSVLFFNHEQKIITWNQLTLKYFDYLPTVGFMWLQVLFMNQSLCCICINSNVSGLNLNCFFFRWIPLQKSIEPERHARWSNNYLNNHVHVNQKPCYNKYGKYRHVSRLQRHGISGRFRKIWLYCRDLAVDMMSGCRMWLISSEVTWTQYMELCLTLVLTSTCKQSVMITKKHKWWKYGI